MTASSSAQSNHGSQAVAAPNISPTGESGTSAQSVGQDASREPATKHVPLAPASKSGDYAFLGATPGSVADAFYMAAAEDWQAAINSRFVNELLDDTLPDSVLISYLVQDFTFFMQPTLERLTAQAPTQEIRDMLNRQAEFFADREKPYFLRFLYGVDERLQASVPQTPANREYCAYLDQIAATGSFAQLLCLMCAMEWLYLAWAKRTVDAGVVQQVPAHRGWVELHEGDLFRRWVGNLIELVNRYASVDGPEAAVFPEVARLERAFFEDSYAYAVGESEEERES
ncbi:TenA family protein [Bifidobacterium thermacidophilum]|uniref:Transcriptional activator TenA n=1 Tax=Bifidobacterium thermacidophilum subsp. thermacidophilum TaxID=79262 RepID=A0A087E6J3_9BIFI|nr:TenA family protein [Bifidobacterium thermacidophilum]KFJ03394.1 transcriptional activator TenA [Bifidobacterium thermacidophilum subsp. thermacidophilum]